MPAAICCDLNRNPDECVFLKVAMAKLGWSDLGQVAHGENTPPPTYYHYGSAHAGMEGHGCSRIDLIFVNKTALAAVQKLCSSIWMWHSQTRLYHSYLSLTVLRRHGYSAQNPAFCYFL